MNTTIINIIKDMLSMKFDGIAPKSVCRTIYDGTLTGELLTEINNFMSELGFKFNFGDYYADSEDFDGFAAGNGRIWVAVRYFGSGKPLCIWGFLRT